MPTRTIIELPPQVRRPFDVFVNGVAQKEGADFDVFGASLVFPRTFTRAPKLGFWRWIFIVTIGLVVGGYDPHDSIDVVHTVNGRRVVTSLVPTPEDEEQY